MAEFRASAKQDFVAEAAQIMLGAFALTVPADAVRALREAALKDDEERALAKAVGGALNAPLAHVA